MRESIFVFKTRHTMRACCTYIPARTHASGRPPDVARKVVAVPFAARSVLPLVAASPPLHPSFVCHVPDFN